MEVVPSYPQGVFTCENTRSVVWLALIGQSVYSAELVQFAKTIAPSYIGC